MSNPLQFDEQSFLLSKFASLPGNEEMKEGGGGKKKNKKKKKDKKKKDK